MMEAHLDLHTARFSWGASPATVGLAASRCSRKTGP
jgi:hypothetical protein